MSGGSPRHSDVSVVIPTYNRRASLLRLLSSLDRQTLDKERFEVVVVDNNSTDGTADAVARDVRGLGLRLRCVSEPEQGAVHARNRGIRETSSPLVAFTDDDIEVEANWLEEILRGFERYSASAVGGRTQAVWDAPLPDWWLPEYERPFARNWGAEACRVTTFPFFYSLNLAVRRPLFSEVGLFDPQLGPKGHRHVVGEDADLCRRIHENGGSLYYLPAALVYHHVEAERLTRRFFRRRFYYAGITHLIARKIESRRLELPYQLKALVTGLAQWLSAPSKPDRFRRELEIWYRTGSLVAGARLLRASADERRSSLRDSRP
jgi:GT2 family glycosyltransferase